MKQVLFLIMFSLAGLSTSAIDALAQGKGYHCEIKKNGKIIDLDKVKNRRECKKKGGKWVKAHDHDHDHGDGGHSHSHE